MNAKKSSSMIAALAVLLVAVVACEPVRPTGPALRLFTPVKSVTATVYGTGDDAYAFVAPALYMEAPTTAFEVQARRSSYASPIKAVASVGGVTKEVPSSILAGWYGFADALTFTWRDAAGKLISHETDNWCPNDGEASRLTPSAAQTSRFTSYCSYHPFSKGQRWGIERGWAVQMLSNGVPAPSLTVGAKYTLQVKFRDAVGAFLGIPTSSRLITYSVKVVQDPSEDSAGTDDHMGASHGAPVGAARSAAQGAPPLPRETKASVPSGAKPDLVALPALGISTHSEDGHDHLDFAATVYNSGQAPLVVDGFRRGSSKVMDAFQSFYAFGQRVGIEKVGEMEYDIRDSHLHWHFRDFAVYDLVNTAGRRVGTSGKEAFCLAPTDAIDLLQPGAVTEPGDGNLETACGDETSIWVREVLSAGWGDTYTQARAGQSIDITDLPNGTYRIRVTANPAGRIREVSSANNVALRTIVLGGTAGERTVKVPAYQLVDSEADWLNGPNA